jgi:multiple sugar transport system permease protein
MMYAIYEKAIQQNLIGIGAAITVVFLGFVLVITFVQRYLVERQGALLMMPLNYIGEGWKHA